jgi:hypothetical protein
MPETTQIKVTVTRVFEEELKKHAAREHRSLSNFCESVLVEAVRNLKWGEDIRSIKRDGRSNDSTTEG